MIRFQLIILLLIFGKTFVLGQEWEWVRQVSGTANDTGFSIDTDNEGNVFIAGRCKGTVTFENDDTPIVVSGFGYGDVFVSKYDKNGNLLWAQLAGSPDFGYDYAEDVVADGEGGCFITGFFLGDCTFGETVYSSSGNRDGFVSHINSAGDFLWTKTFGGSGIDQGYGLSMDNEGNVLFCGLVTGIIEIEGETMGFAGEYYGFSGKLNFDGDLIEIHFLQPPYKSNVYSVTVDDEDNIYMCGAIFGSSTFNGTALVTEHSPSRPDAFVLKCDSDFNPIWFQSSGGNYYDQAFDVAVSSTAIYVSGSFAHDAVFDTIARSVGDDGVTLEEINGARNMYLASYDRNSGDVQWVIDGGYDRIDEIQGVKVGASENVYFTGVFRDSIAILDTVLYAGGLNSSQIITGKVDPLGNLIWIRQSGNNAGNASYGLSVDSYENVFVSGSFSEYISFDGLSFSAQERDAFGGKLTQHPNPTYSLNGTSFCPGDTLIVTLNGITSPLTYSYSSDDGYEFWTDSTTIYYLIADGSEMSLNGTIYAENNLYLDSVLFSELIDVYEMPGDILPNDSLTCASFILTIEDIYASYDWNDGVIMSNEISIDTSGIYNLFLTTLDGCEYRDTVTVIIPEEILLFLPMDTSACDSITISVPEGYESYSWNEGLDMDDEIEIEESGLYKIVVLDEYGCEAVDSVNVEILEVLSPNLMDTISCGTLNYIVSDEYVTYNWNDGEDFDAEIEINENGLYTLFVIDENGCIGYDSMNVEVLLVEVELPEDTILCDYLTYTIVVPDVYESYVWSTGAEGVNEIEVSESGEYTLTVTDEFGCDDSDTISVLFTDCLGISESNFDEQRLMYSFQNKTLFNSSLDPIKNVLIIGVSGDKVMTIDLIQPSEKIRLDNLSSGIYYVVFLDENNVVNRTKIMTLN